MSDYFQIYLPFLTSTEDKEIAELCCDSYIGWSEKGEQYQQHSMLMCHQQLCLVLKLISSFL